MCIVHRVINDPSTNTKATVRFEFPPKKGITLSTREIMRMALGLSRPVDYVYTCADTMASVAERVRRQYRLHLAASESFAPVPKERRSPQTGGNVLADSPDRHDDGSCGPRHGFGASYRNCGRKPRNKHHRLHATAW